MDELKLSRTAKKILNALAEADSEFSTVEEVAVYVGMSPKTITRQLQDENFRGLLFETMKGNLTRYTPGVLNSLTTAALAGSFKHQALFLELIGMYDKTQKMKGEISIGGMDESPFKNEEAKKAFIRETLRGLGES